MSPVITSGRRVVVVPVSVVNRSPHFCWVAVVKAIGTAIVLVAPVVLGIGYIRVVVELVQVHR